MTEQCFNYGLPAPLFFFKSSGFWVEFRKDIYHEKQLTELGLNQRQIRAVLFLKENDRITNKEYQKINDTAERTASRDLTYLVDNGIINSSGVKGAGAFYTLNKK